MGLQALDMFLQRMQRTPGPRPPVRATGRHRAVCPAIEGWVCPRAPPPSSSGPPRPPPALPPQRLAALHTVKFLGLSQKKLYNEFYAGNHLVWYPRPQKNDFWNLVAGSFYVNNPKKLTNFKSRLWTRDTCHVASEGTSWKLKAVDNFVKDLHNPSIVSTGWS